MKIFSNILIIILSISFFGSPALVSANAAHHSASKMSCCTGENHSCHHSQQEENQNKKNHPNDCNDTSCPMNSCHYQNSSVKVLSKQEFSNTETIVFESNQIKDNHFSILILKELIYSFWHPPEYIL